MRLHLKKCLAGLAAAFLVLALAEGVLRLAGFAHTPHTRSFDHISTLYEVGTRIGFRPTTYVDDEFMWLPLPDNPFTDPYGFRAPGIREPKPPGVIRVAFIGGSTTEGGYHSYAERAIRLINAAAGSNVYEMMNAACSAYSSMQSRKVLENKVFNFAPDLVVNYDGWNEFSCWQDGYSDAEKEEGAKSRTAAMASRAMPWLSRLKLYQLVGMCVDRFDRSWPRVRMTEEEYLGNMRRMVQACRARSLPVILVLRPYSRGRPLAATWHDEELVKRMGMTDLGQLYDWRYEKTARVQRQVLSEFDYVHACDAYAMLNQLQEHRDAGHFGSDIGVFAQDGIHLEPYAEQKLGEFLAFHLAPKYQDAIAGYIMSFNYLKALAEESLAEDLVPEAAWYLDRAQAARPGADLEAMRKELAEGREFARLFDEGKLMGGTEDPVDMKLEKLRRCVEIRPHDVNLIVQIFHLCEARKTIELAADAIAGFKPASGEDSLQWLLLTFYSHVAGKRTENALQVAQEILRLNPGEQEVADYVASLTTVSE